MFLDAREMPCPRPVAETKILLKQMAPGEIITILCKDKMTLIDLKAFCAVAGHEILDVSESLHFFQIKIQKAFQSTL